MFSFARSLGRTNDCANGLVARADLRGCFHPFGISGPDRRKSIVDFGIQRSPSERYVMETDPSPTESIDELRQRLNNMKKLMAERQGGHYDGEGRRRTTSSIIDGSFLSVVFGIALVVILTVSIYAFYNLYNAILKKFPSKHTEL